MRRKQAVAVFSVGLLLVLGCSTDSPTAPVQEPMPPSGGTASATWRITVSADPDELTVGSSQPTTVSIRVVRADNNQPPPTGTTMVVSSSLGEFDSAGSGIRSVAIGTANGFGSALLFAGDVIGTAFVTAQLEASVGQTSFEVVPEVDPVVASFSFSNTENNLSIQFQNTSTGNPTKFRWDFGDGATSTEEHPAHLYGAPGDYVVSLTASKTGSSDTTSELVVVDDSGFEVDFEFVQEGRRVVFRDTTTGEPNRWRWNFGDGRTSSQQNPTHTYSRDGTFVVTLSASRGRSSGEASKTVTVEGDLFISGLTPNIGNSGTRVTISGIGFSTLRRVFFDGVPASVVSHSDSSIVVIVPIPKLETVTESCNDNNDAVTGFRYKDVYVTVSIELVSGASDSLDNAFIYDFADNETCFDD